MFFITLFIIVPMLSLRAMYSDSDDENDIFTRRLPRELQIRALSDSYNRNIGNAQSNRLLAIKPDGAHEITSSFHRNSDQSLPLFE